MASVAETAADTFCIHVRAYSFWKHVTIGGITEQTNLLFLKPVIKNKLGDMLHVDGLEFDLHWERPNGAVGPALDHKLKQACELGVHNGTRLVAKPWRESE